MTGALHTASDICVWAVFISAVCFNILYTLKAAWWRSWMGRNLFAMDTCVGMAMIPGVVQMAFGVDTDTTAYGWLIVSVLGVVALLVLHRIYMLLRVQPGWSATADWFAGTFHALYAGKKEERGADGDNDGG